MTSLSQTSHYDKSIPYCLPQITLYQQYRNINLQSQTMGIQSSTSSLTPFYP